jgi:antitoxin CcdA
MSETIARRPVNLSISVDLIAEAKELKLNVSRLAEAGIHEAVAAERRRLWLEENAEALESSNRYVEQHGLPLASRRLF